MKGWFQLEFDLFGKYLVGLLVSSIDEQISWNTMLGVYCFLFLKRLQQINQS